MSPVEHAMTADDVQVLENVLDDSRVPRLTRRTLLATAGAAAATAAVPGVAFGRGFAHTDAISDLGTAAVTAEALAVTYLSTIIVNVGGKFPADVGMVLKAANTAEQDHYEFLSGAGFKPLTTKFWIPDAAFVPQNIAPLIEYFEQIFVNAYLVGTTLFAGAGKADLARYTVEIGAVEAEHRTLARALQKKLPDNLGFTSYTLKTVAEHVAAIEAAGVGFGKPGAKPGRFYMYSGPLPGTTTTLGNSKPDQPAS
jgi:hypothetical protein